MSLIHVSERLDDSIQLVGKECVIGIEARGSPLLHKGGLEGVPDQKRVILTVPIEHPELMGDGSLGGSTNPLSFNLPLLKSIIIWGHSSSDDSAFGVQNFGFASRFLL